MARNKAYPSKQVARITTTLDIETKRLLDAAIEGRGLTRSEAVAEAIADWVERADKEDLDRTYGFSQEFERLRAMVGEAQMLSGMAVESMRDAGVQTDEQELRRRANNLRRRADRGDSR